jgi:CobQ-like glutamine amidotransferase family enzyme
MQVFIFALIAIALSDNGNIQTIRYHSTIKECQLHLEEVKATVDKDLVRLDCVPITVKDYK